MKKRILIASLVLLGCDNRPDMTMTALPSHTAVATEINTRISVTKTSMFKDELAYGGARGIYVIYDSKTGKEFIGISGIGISEAGSHNQSNGKATYSVQDER